MEEARWVQKKRASWKWVKRKEWFYENEGGWVSGDLRREGGGSTGQRVSKKTLANGCGCERKQGQGFDLFSCLSKERVVLLGEHLFGRMCNFKA